MTTSPRPRPQGTLFALAVMGAAIGLAGCASAPEAKDGTDIDACRDGECEVAVSKPTDIPLDGELGVTTVSVTAIDDEEVTVSCATGSSSGSEGGGEGKMSLLEPGGGALPCGDLELSVSAIADGTAVVVLEPA